MRKTLQVLVMTFLFILSLSLPAWALDWTPPRPTPSCYAGREYTRQHWADFYVDEHGTSWSSINRANARFLFSGYASVFDLRNDLKKGYTAIGGKDGAAVSAAFYLDALGIPLVDGYWIVSPGFYKEKYGSNPSIYGGADCCWDVPVNAVKSSSGLTSKDTLDNPKCFKNGPDGFEAGGYHTWVYNGQTYYGDAYHWFSRTGSKRAPIAVTKEYASKIGYALLGPNGMRSSFTTRAEISFNYYYGLSAIQLTPVGSPSNGKQTWEFTVFNTAPYVAKNVKLRAYIVHNGKYELAANTKTDIGPLPVRNPFGGFQQPTTTWTLGQGVKQSSAFLNTITWTFEVPVPSGQYKVLATANLEFSSGKGNPEPLETVVAYGHSGVSDIVGLTGRKMEVEKHFIPSGNVVDAIIGGNMAYVDNYLMSGQQSGYQPPGPGPQPGANDLAVTDIQVLDAQTGQPVSSPQENQPLKVKATFASGFDVGGWAKIRLYKYQAEYKRLDEVDSTSIYLEPHGTYTKEWGTYTVGTGQYKFIATICLYNTGNDPATGWRPEKFDGKHDESTYDNNRKEADLTGTEAPPREPQPREASEPAWYPPLTWKEKPIYEPITEPVYGWKKVKFTKEEAEGKVRVRLIE